MEQADLMREVIFLQALKDGQGLTDAHSKAQSKLGALVLLIATHSSPPSHSGQLEFHGSLQAHLLNAGVSH